MMTAKVGQRFGNKYEVKEVINRRDSTVSVYIATDIETQEEVALKLSSDYYKLKREARFYRSQVQTLEGFPSLKWFWKEKHRNGAYGVLAMDLLGPSLDSLMEKTKKGEFSLKTTLQIMDQVITRIQALHECQWIHRGIKPDNFCIGPIGSKSEGVVYLIDFDDVYQYISPYGNHFRDWGDNQGNRNWTSLAVDEGRQTIRRDDMESAGYMAVYFLKGWLPWHGHSYHHSHSTMGYKKDTSLDDLCEDLPQEFITYLAYCRSLAYTQQPDYDYCRRLFRQVFEREGFRDDGVCDWMAPQSVGESEKLRPTFLR
ncbi:hypothetical protein L202_07574 [Cryptococcus amylolentus CBS 6039]|uniref:Protein kinase domain-containing protein n=2 Tax=Cryptococcus amylolentus TaxID=104669 RepID=A0A1E3HCP8_9TREE|nr:hypothetical protein L202_07574 [Cryptococcus amylolentus CBS 6039]ODN74117.1 hypothetical protein L202_07574 [Cryptococcus amylolentus CBS 6039]